MDDLSGWLRYLRVERGLADATIAAYARDVRVLGPSVRLLRTDELRGLLHSRNDSPATVARRLAAWRSYYGWAVRTGVRVDDPTLTLARPKPRRGLPRPVADLDERLYRLDPVCQTIAIFLVETGLRISEATTVSVRTPEMPETLLVRGKGSKDRLVPLTTAAREALGELGGHLPLSARTIQRRFAEVGFTPHQLRHTLATSLISTGADLGDVQELLGHASPATTRIYAAYSTDRLRAALERRR